MLGVEHLKGNQRLVYPTSVQQTLRMMLRSVNLKKTGCQVDLVLLPREV